MEKLLIVVVGFLLSGVVGSYIVSRWQHGTWVNQQKLRKAEQALSELRILVSRITHLADKRNYRARKLCRSVGRVDDEELKRLKLEYETSVTEWNDEWTYFTVSLTLFADYVAFVPRLESEIQKRFVLVGSALLYLQRSESIDDARGHRAKIENLLNDLSGAMFHFSRDLQSRIQAKENETYAGRRWALTSENLDDASLLELFKALFRPLQPR